MCVCVYCIELLRLVKLVGRVVRKFVDAALLQRWKSSREKLLELAGELRLRLHTKKRRETERGEQRENSGLLVASVDVCRQASLVRLRKCMNSSDANKAIAELGLPTHLSTVVHSSLKQHLGVRGQTIA